MKTCQKGEFPSFRKWFWSWSFGALNFTWIFFMRYCSAKNYTHSPQQSKIQDCSSRINCNSKRDLLLCIPRISKNPRYYKVEHRGNQFLALQVYHIVAKTQKQSGVQLNMTRIVLANDKIENFIYCNFMQTWSLYANSYIM